MTDDDTKIVLARLDKMAIDVKHLREHNDKQTAFIKDMLSEPNLQALYSEVVDACGIAEYLENNRPDGLTGSAMSKSVQAMRTLIQGWRIREQEGHNNG